MTTIQSFVNRLSKIGIQVELIGNYPWIYLHKVNGKRVVGNFMGNHGFTVFFKAIHPNGYDKITSIDTIFSKIREMLK